METRPLISVVMPIYKVEKALKHAIDSILNQTYTDYEIILVDDCSPDGCPDICDQYALNHDNIQALHLKKNGGLSNARNQGQKLANGRYIFFMDSDDSVDSDLFENIRKSVEKNPAKLLVFGLIEEYYNGKGELRNIVKIQMNEECYKDKNDIRKALWKLEEKTMLGYAWNKIYDLDYLNEIGIQFENVTLIEDIVFNIKYTRDIDTMNILPISPYHYNCRLNQSLTHKFVKDYFALHYKRVRMLYDEYLEWGLLDSENEKFFANRFFRYVLSALQRNCDKQAGMGRKQRKEWVLQLYEDAWITRMFSKADYGSSSMNLLVRIIREKNVFFTLLCGQIIYLIKNRLPIFFSRVKQRGMSE